MHTPVKFKSKQIFKILFYQVKPDYNLPYVSNYATYLTKWNLIYVFHGNWCKPIIATTKALCTDSSAGSIYF